MKALFERAERIARTQQRRTVERLSREISERLEGAEIERAVDRVVIRGRGLVRRWLLDPALRFLGSMQR